MKDNIYWQFAEGGEFPVKFHSLQWSQAWCESIRHLKRSLSSFKRNPNKDRYNKLVRSMARNTTLRSLSTNMPLFLGEYNEKEYRDNETKTLKDLEVFDQKSKESIKSYLQNLLETGGEDDKTWIKNEFIYWSQSNEPSLSAEILRQRVESDESMLMVSGVEHLSYFPSVKKKLKNNAKNMGLRGYAVSPRDPDVDLIIGLQQVEEKREQLWRDVQENSIKDQAITEMLIVREEQANEEGYEHYTDMLDKSMRDFKLNSVSKQISKQIKSLANPYNNLKDALIDYGRVNSNGNENLSRKPWNDMHLSGRYDTKRLYITGDEFPLQRVIDYIIPDILSIGGWLVDGEIDKIGKNTRCLYKYNLINKDKKAVLLFAPYPAANFKDDDIYKAYASSLRERWSTEGDNTPVALVAQNFELANGGLDNLGELEYLAHEIGHVLHYFSFSGESFNEFSRMSLVMGELPSTLMENIVKDPRTLRKWSDPNCKKAKRLDYWQRRVREDPLKLINYMDNLQRAWLDINVHNKSASDVNISSIIDNLKKKCGIRARHKDDKTYHKMFDFTEFAGQMSCYNIGYALGRGIMSGENSEKDVREKMRHLLDNVLSYSSDMNMDIRWKRVYGRSIFSMFCDGLDDITQEHMTIAEQTLSEIKNI